MAEGDTDDLTPAPELASIGEPSGQGVLPASPELASFGLLDLYAAGDDGFVSAIRAVRDAPALARFAATWYADPRPEARRLLWDYLAQPPNAPGHEGLVKRLFKLAERADDAAVMARFLVLTDRLISPRRQVRHHWVRRRFATAAEAEAQASVWVQDGWSKVHSYRRLGVAAVLPRPHVAAGLRPQPLATTRGTTLPRPDWRQGEALAALTPEQIAGRRWFRVATRRHLQRRVWRYFRRLGRTDPARYVRAATTALMGFDAADLPTGYALLDRFNLIHLLFGASPALRLRSTGWDLAPGSTLADLAPAPAFADAWRAHPEQIALLARAHSALAPTIVRWAWRWVAADPQRYRRTKSHLGIWQDCLWSPDPEVVQGTIQLLESPGLDQLRAEVAGEPRRWTLALALAHPTNRPLVADFIERLVEPGQVDRFEAIRLARHPDEVLARLGWRWVVAQGVAPPPGGDDGTADAIGDWALLLMARCPAVRPAILAALRAVGADGSDDRSRLASLFLTCPHADARAEGLAWLRADDRLWADSDLWARLAASPYPEIQALVATSQPPAPVDPAQGDAARAAVLLAPRGQARRKPGAIRGVVRRLEALAAGGGEEAEVEAEVDRWLAILADLTRSVHAPERRAALAALVGLAERFPAWAGRVEGLVPALQLGGGSAIVPG